MSKKVHLSCDICGGRNYSISTPKSNASTRLTLKKFCKHCNQQTVHKQTV